MNVIRMENAKVRPARGRGRGKGRDHLYWKSCVDKPISNTFHQPKYQSSCSETPRPLFNIMPSSSSVRTPSSTRRNQGIPSSSSARIRSSASTNLQAATSTSGTLDSTVIMAITSGRGDARCEIGMAAIDVKFPHLIISQISDTQTYANTLMKIHLFNPVEILMPETMCGEEDPRKKLYSTIKTKFKDIQISPIWRTHFNEENGLDRIKTHCATEFSSIELFVKEKYYALASTAALLKYVEQIQHIVYEPKSMKIEFQASQGSTSIDIESAINLELVASQGPQKNHNLFSSLDRCVTPMGRRLLRSSILQPLCDLDAILERQTCVSELVRNRNLHTVLQPIIKQLFGADRLLGLSMRTAFTRECIEAAERNLNYILLLKTCLEVIPQLASALETASSPKFVKIRENLRDPRFQNMKEQILEIIQIDARSVNGYTSANMQRCFALKSGMNDMLDVARQTYCELMEQTTILVDSLAQEYKLSLTIACNASLGYHIQMQMPKHPNFKISDLPSVFIEVQKKRNNLFMTTYLLMSLNQQCKDARNELHIMSSCILEALICSLRNQVTCLFQLSEDIAELDFVMSIARISGIPDFVKPTFGQSLRIIDSKHPVVDILGTELPRPNNIEASIAYNFCNITGPNMSGKTTYLKQVVLLHIMAQIGCYLPAKEATLRIADRIFCRLCPTYEDIESNASSFIQEIKEIEYILQFNTPTSLIILDEICRSTNSEEGAPIAFAICETLLQSTAFIFNCTHFISLTKLTEFYHNAVNYFFVCEPNELDKWGLKYTYKLRKGVTCAENYGISAASACRLPKQTIEKAKEFVAEIAHHFKPIPLAKAPKLSWQKDCYDCIAKIMDLIISNEYTLENVQLIVQPLRGNKNLKFSKENDLLYNVLEKNFQKQAPDHFQKTMNVMQTQTMTNVPQNNSEISNIVQYNTNIPNYLDNIIFSDSEALRVHQVSVHTSNALHNNSGVFNLHQINAIESNLHNEGRFSNIDQMNLIDSDLNPFGYQDPFPYKSLKTSHPNYETFHKNDSKQVEQNFPFKIPIAISPTIKNKKSNKIKHTKHQESIRTPDVNNFAIFQTRTSPSTISLKKLSPINKSLASFRNSTLYEFGFSKNQVSNEKCSLGRKDFQDFPKEDPKSVTSTNSLKLQTSNLSNLIEERTSSNISSSSTCSKMGSNFNQDETSRSQRLNSSNLSTPRNWLQDEMVSASNYSERIRQTDQEDDFRSPSQKISPSLNNSRNSLHEEIESQRRDNHRDDDSRRSLSQKQSLSNFSPLQSSIQGEIQSRSRFFEKNCQSDQDDISRRSLSRKQSLSNFSPPQSSIQREIESRSSFLEKNCRSDQDNISRRSLSQKQSLSNFTTPQSAIQRENKSRGNIFEMKYQSDQDNISRRSLSRKQSLSNFSPPQSSIQREIESRSNLFEKKYESEQDNISRRSLSRKQRLSNFSPPQSSIQREIESRSNLFEKKFESEEDNISRRSLSRKQSLSNFSPPQSSIQREIDSRSNLFEKKFESEEDNISRRSLSRKQSLSNFSPPQSSIQREIESRNSFLEKNCRSDQDNISRRSLSQKQSLSNFTTPQSAIQRENKFRGNIFEMKCQSDQDNISRSSLCRIQSPSNFSPVQSLIKREIESRGCLLKKDENNIFRGSQFQSPSSISKINWKLDQLKNFKRSQAENEVHSSLNISSNSVQREIKSANSPLESKLYFNHDHSGNSPSNKQKSLILNISRNSFQEELESRNKSHKQKWQIVEDESPKKSQNSFLSKFKFSRNSVPKEMESRRSPHNNDRPENVKASQLQNPSQARFNIFKFPTPQPQASRISVFEPQINAWQPHEIECFKRSLSQNHSHSDIEVSRNSFLDEIDSEAARPKKLKFDINLEKQDVSLNSIKNVIQDTLSSFNTANLSFSLNTTPIKNSISFKASAHNNENSLSPSKSQYKSPSQNPNAFSDLIWKTKKNNNLIMKNKDSEIVSPSEVTISEFESILDEDTIEIDDISEYPSPNPETKNSDIVTISSVDTIEAVNNIRRREDEIFREIEENATDGEMFLQRMFNSPLSVPCSEELCSCSYSSSTRD